jgi:hypothetical protein
MHVVKPADELDRLSGPERMIRAMMRTAAAVGLLAALLAALGAAPAHADPAPEPPTPYQIAGPDGPLLPVNEVLPPVCAHAMQTCGFFLDPGTMTWLPRGTSAP